ILKNALPVAHRLGFECPKVAVLAMTETVNPKMPETLDADALSKMDIQGCMVQGPLALDLAVSKHAAEAKGITGPVAGQADILLVPSVLVGNIFCKGIMYFAESRFGGIVAGTTHPVAFLSRSDETDAKLNTIALGVLLGKGAS
ncbi:MAG: phosphate butyryltransferase, partial [bacterium]|nr:phosphate butyryltransferase [bacterium]